MNFIRRYWLLEATFLIIALCGFGLAAYNIANADTVPNDIEQNPRTVLAVTNAEDPYPGPGQEPEQEDEGDDMAIPEDEDADDDPFEDEDEEEVEGDDEFEDDEVEEETENDDESENDEEFEEEDNEESDNESESNNEDFEDEDDEDDESDNESEEDEFEEIDDPLNAVAELVGLDLESLENDLSAGNSLAEIATANGVDPQTVIDMLVNTELGYLQQEVEAGEIDPAELEEIEAEINAYVAIEVNTAYREPEAVAAEILGIDQGSLWEALENGQTIEALANVNGVDPQTIIDAVVAAESEYVDQMLAADLIDQAERDEFIAEIEAEVSEMVTTTFDDHSEEECNDEEVEEETEAEN